MVADTALSAKAQNVMVHMGWPHCIKAGMDGTGEVTPGAVVTETGLTADTNLCQFPDGANDVPWGIAGRNPEHDIDTAYAQYDEFPVYLVGGGHVVWGRCDDSQTILKGTQLDAGAAGDGRVVVSTEANVIEAVGLAYSYVASVAAELPIMILLR